MHKLWLNITSDPKYSGLHHYHVVALALQELEKELDGNRREELLRELQAQLNNRQEPPTPPS